MRVFFATPASEEVPHVSAARSGAQFEEVTLPAPCHIPDLAAFSQILGERKGMPVQARGFERLPSTEEGSARFRVTYFEM